MNTITSQPLIGSHSNSYMEKARIKTATSTMEFQPKIPKSTDQTILPFSFSEYPFLNDPHSPVASLKTIVSFKLTSDSLQQLVNVNHPNIISIRKIVKTNPRESQHLNSGKISYTFFYEPVLYGIKYLSEHPDEHPRLFNLLLSFDLKTIILSVHGYLQGMGISHGFRIQDLGITAEGNLKLYLAPNAVVQSKHQSMVQRSIQLIIDWWGDYLESLDHTPFRKDKKSLQPPKLVNNNDLSLEDPSIEEGIDENELEKELGCLLDDDPTPKKSSYNYNDLKSSTQSLSRVGSIQLEKMKKIDQQVKHFRAKLNEKQMQHNKAAEQMKNKKVEFHKPYPQTKADQHYEPIQQNINCINIYNHNNHHAPLASPHHFPNMPNYYYPYQPYYQQQMYENEDGYSQDTYDIQFENQFEQGQGEPQKDKDNYRHTIYTPSQRDLSEHPKRKPKRKDINNEEMNFRNNSNQVYKNKNYTQSAGPLQFKSFVNKYMKPKLQQLQETKPEPSLAPSIVNNAQSMRSYSINQKNIKAESTIMHRNHSQNEFQPINTLKTRYKTDIENKVKMALEKTKNAIALLNKVKQSKNSKHS